MMREGFIDTPHGSWLSSELREVSYSSRALVSGCELFSTANPRMHWRIRCLLRHVVSAHRKANIMPDMDIYIFLTLWSCSPDMELQERTFSAHAN
jgi:hypothetical protein